MKKKELTPEQQIIQWLDEIFDYTQYSEMYYELQILAKELEIIELQQKIQDIKIRELFEYNLN